MNRHKNLASSIALIVLLLFQISCLKKQNLEDGDLVSKADPSTIQEKMEEGAGGFSQFTARVNESSSLSATVTFADSQSVPYYDQVLTIDSAIVSGTSVLFNLLYTKTNYSDASDTFSSKQIVWDPHVTIGNAELSQKLLKMQKAASQPTFLMNYYMSFSYECTNPDYTCYNLKYEDTVIKLPISLADKRICEDLSNCIIPVRQVEFDIVNQKQLVAGKPERAHVRFLISRKLPYLSKVLNMCYRTLALYGNELKPIVREDCFGVTDFTIGDDYIKN